MNDLKLLNKLIQDEKKINRDLYSSGPYWDYKNKKTIYQIKKWGIQDFRGMNTGIGTSYADNIVCDARNEFNIRGRIIASLFSLPLLRTIHNEQLKVTSSHINNYLKNLSIVYQNNDEVLKLLKKYKFENTTEFGCIKKFTNENKEYAISYLNIAYRIDFLSRIFQLNKIKSFFEIGGGFGSNIHFLITNFSNIKKIIYLDVVPNIYVGTQYLKSFYGDSVKDYLFTHNLSQISFSNNNDLEILCVPPWEIEKLNIQMDHFHNASSFVEMPEKIINNYIKFVKKFNTKEISLISYDEYNPKTTFNPELLNNFFENKLNIEWVDELIKQYKKKLIFLTSKSHIK